MGQLCMKLKPNRYLEADKNNDGTGEERTFLNRVPKTDRKKSAVHDEESAIREQSEKKKKSKSPMPLGMAYIEAQDAEIDPQAQKSQDDKKLIITALNNHFIFTSLTDEDKDMVAESMQLYIFQIGSTVFEQEKPSRSYYVVKSGVLEVLVNGKRVNRIHPGEGFGELALLHDNPRSATVRCLDKTLLWGIERQTFRKVIEEMNTQIYEQNREFLEKVALLQPLSSRQKDSLAASLVACKYTSGQKIISEGESGQQLFIIKEGTVSVQKGSQEIARLHAGGYFGEMALLTNAPRSATCVAIEGPVKCVSLSRETLQKTLGNQLQDIIEKNTIMEAINKSETLSYLNKDQKDSIIRELHIKSYKGGDIVIQAGTLCNSKLYIIITGRLQFAKTTQLFADKGTAVGDVHVTQTLAEDQKYEDDMIASADMKVGELTKYRFEVSIGGRYEDVVKENAATNVLRKVYLFNTLDSTKMKELFGIIRSVKYAEGETIIKEKTPIDSVYIVKRGKVDLRKNGELIRTVMKHDYFGERGFLIDNISTVTAVANGSVTVWVIQNNDFIQLVNENMRKQLLKRIKIEDERVELKDLIVIKMLGKGMFGKVYLVRPASAFQLYALKAISRRKIDVYAIQEHLLLEKHILLLIDHPFIVKMVRTYKDEKRIYFLLEYVHGLELSMILRHVGLLSNSDSQFYIASLVLVLQYLHERDIIYRDVKPDNVMVDSNGFIKLIDFGTAKQVQGRTYTLVGTYHYMSPEAIVGKGYNKNADLWSLGICLYEFLCGRVPFGEDEEDPYKIYEAILDMNLDYPSDIEGPSESAKSLIGQLLSKLGEHRSGGSIENLKKHEWFAGFDWEGLMHQTIVPPYTPDVGDNFEDIEEDDAELHEPWDQVLNQESEDSDMSIPEVIDTELEEFKSSIPRNWDAGF
ncbi:unnamed protein product [Blepharisma stoltei]|uniref:cGMP-dependent protein kinase n=1 Tax=Blepharisma stoltei TaxID=1481888 RepID=A0AAU9JYK4_9CILI|nr:unnamed protein product [Blepharisma stoltei]